MPDSTNKIVCGDCVAGMTDLPEGSVDLVFADPPFNIGYDYDTYDDARADDDYLGWSHKWMSEVARILKPNGTFWLAIGDEYAAELKVSAQRELGFTCRSWVVWYYTFGVNCTRKFSRSHAHLFHFVKDPENFTFNFDDIRVPSARQLVYNDTRANPRGRLPDDTWILRPQDLPEGFSADEDTWYFPRVCGTFKERAGWHGCQMPEQLLGRIIRACSNENEVVLDPFSGSGTTLAVAHKLGRRWLGFEMSDEYVKQINKRLAGVIVGDRLEGAEEPLVSVPSTKDAASGTRRRSPKPSTNGNDRPAKRRRAAADDEQRGRTQRSRAKRSDDAPGRRSPNGDAGASDKIQQAYVAACSGLSIDRVLTDPAANARFVQRCADLGIAGTPTRWNHQLIGLRKAGKLKAVPKPQRTHVSANDIDRFIFASEIAWRLLADRTGLSLDEILCDPELARRFDDGAERLAPGWTAFQYRWAALKLRKQAREMCRHAEQLPDDVLAMTFSTTARALDRPGRVPAEPGLYVLSAGRKRLYLGATTDLAARLATHATHLEALVAELGHGDVSAPKIRARILVTGNDIPERHRLGLLSHYLGQYRPSANANLDHQAYVTA